MMYGLCGDGSRTTGTEAAAGARMVGEEHLHSESFSKYERHVEQRHFRMVRTNEGVSPLQFRHIGPGRPRPRVPTGIPSGASQGHGVFGSGGVLLGCDGLLEQAFP